MMRRALNAISAILGFCLTSGVVFAVTINTNIPGGNPTVNNPGGWVANFYQFALLLGGLLAFGAIVYGGITYTLSAGNPEKQSDAKSRITQALLGLTLLLGAYIVLNFLNPKLTNLQIDTYGLTAAYTPPVPLTGSLAQDIAEAEAAHKKAQAAANKADELEAEAARLRSDAENVGGGAGSEAFQKENRDKAQQLEREAANLRADTVIDLQDRQMRIAELSQDAEAVKIHRNVIDGSLNTSIKELEKNGDKEGASQLLFKKFKEDIGLDGSVTATIIAAAKNQNSGYIAGANAGAIENMRRIAAAGTAYKNDPVRAAAVQKASQDAINKIKAECAKQNLSCKNFQPNP